MRIIKRSFEWSWKSERKIKVRKSRSSSSSSKDYDYEYDYESNSDGDQEEDQEEEKESDIFDELMILKESNQFREFESKLQQIRQGKNSKDRACALYELALLYCQLGDPKYEPQIHQYLSSLGFQFKLGKGIWNFDINRTASLKQTNRIAYCYDNILNESLLTSLRVIFASNSQFWSYHQYPTSKFFSYNEQLRKKKKKSASGSVVNIIEQLAQYLLPIVSQSFPDLSLETQVTSIEWWAHNRPNGSATGHRLHFDLDEIRLQHFHDEGRSIEERSRLHPLVSSVIYLDDGGTSAAPTLIIDESLSGKSRNAAWLCPPQTNRVLFFRGDRLHGVIPHICQSSSTSRLVNDPNPINSPSSRITLMIGWWGTGVSTTPSPTPAVVSTSSFTPNMRLPSPDTAPWVTLLNPLPSLPSLSTTTCHPTPLVTVVGDVWEPVIVPPSENGSIKSLMDPDVVFVGNWFLRSRFEILEEVFSSNCDETNSHTSPSCGASTSPEDAVEWISLEELKKLRNRA